MTDKHSVQRGFTDETPGCIGGLEYGLQINEFQLYGGGYTEPPALNVRLLRRRQKDGKRSLGQCFWQTGYCLRYSRYSPVSPTAAF